VRRSVTRSRRERHRPDIEPGRDTARISVSPSDLSAALLPTGDIAADHALARYVGESIERRLPALLGRPDAAKGTGGNIVAFS
jgi:hypothetical protein